MRLFEEIWHRGAAALRLSTKVYRGEWGAWLEMAKALPGRGRGIPSKGGSKYDWEHKFALRLSRDDLAKLAWAFEQRDVGDLISLVHHYQGTKKFLKIVLAQNGSYFLNGSKNAVTVSVPIEKEGIWKMRTCLNLAYEEALWNESAYEKQQRCAM